MLPWYVPQLALEAWAVGEHCAGAVLVRCTATRGAVVLRLRRDRAYEAQMLHFLGRFGAEFASSPRAAPPPADFWADEPEHARFVAATLAYAESAEVLEVVAPADVQRAGRDDEPLLFPLGSPKGA